MERQIQDSIDTFKKFAKLHKDIHKIGQKHHRRARSPQPFDKSKVTVVLDLDETLIHSTPNYSRTADFSISLPDGFNGSSLTYIHVRPGA